MFDNWRSAMLKRILALALCIIMILSLTACGGKEDASSAVVKIGLLSIDDSLPFFMAEKLCLYEKHGVKVELVPFGSATDKETALIAGELDGDMTDLIVTALLKKGGTDVKIVSIALGAKTEEGRFDILSAPGSGITEVSQLAGIPVAVGNNTIVHYLSDKIQALAGTNSADITSQNIPSLSLRYESLMNGTIQAAVLPDPLASLAAASGANVVYDDTKGELNLSQSIVLFTEKALTEKSKEISLAMDAYFEAMEYINEHPDSEDVRNAIKEFSSVPEALFESYATPSYTPNALPDEEIIKDTMSWMIEKGLLDKAYTYEEIVYTK